ncbi:hypothetical protein PGT21_022214 [Puccinia graminis f. sp. tritici]|nr:hypothetical protein PGT21_022214 [Puccinia graminis f. sp. tritici]KAA1097045.1 hypothetical protein PGTUg99_003828 [Puccinia graminis f. sp. tritici]
MYAALDKAAVSAIQVLDDELELARTEKTLEAAINKEARVAAVQVSEENFFPELDRAAVDALEELDQHLATLRGNGSGEILADEARLLANSPPLPEL